MNDQRLLEYSALVQAVDLLLDCLGEITAIYETSEKCEACEKIFDKTEETALIVHRIFKKVQEVK